MEKKTVDVGDEVSGLDFDETVLKLGLPGVRDGGTKRGFSDSDLVLMSSGDDGSVESKASDDSWKPSASKAQVVGWPPVRSFRKNALKNCNYVKVAVDGVPYLRKVDLQSYDSYEQLLTVLGGMFYCFKIRYSKNDRKLVDPMNGTEYVSTYEDKDGDWMLAGDVPWKMFVESCKRLRLMKRSKPPRQACLSA